ncbi:MAG: hypothetical protein L0387_02035 [Acidobacteria bacterium]|nr:hypothetical protein [Acidobacteriota bacterium]
MSRLIHFQFPENRNGKTFGQLQFALGAALLLLFLTDLPIWEVDRRLEGCLYDAVDL